MSLTTGFDLLVDEIENHSHKTLVENLIMLYKDNFDTAVNYNAIML